MTSLRTLVAGVALAGLIGVGAVVQPGPMIAHATPSTQTTTTPNTRTGSVGLRACAMRNAPKPLVAPEYSTTIAPMNAKPAAAPSEPPACQPVSSCSSRLRASRPVC